MGTVDALAQTLPALAIALAVCLALGHGAARLGIPRVTVYLLVGLLLGPHGLPGLLGSGADATPLFLGSATDAPFHALEQLTIGFILFGVGGGFRIEQLRHVGPRVAAVVACEVGAVAILVFLAVLTVTGDLRLAAIAPALAVATAPSATLVTLREVEAEGPTSRMLILAVGLDNLAALLAFPLLLALAFGGGHPVGATALAITALTAGSLVGFLGAVSLEVFSGRREQIVLAIGVVAACVGGAHWVSPGSAGLAMLACFGAGVAVANGSPHADRLFRWLENTVYPLYVLFFIAAGRELHLEALATLGVLGILFISARTLGKLVGTAIGLRATRLAGELPPSLGTGLLCQAGVALGLLAALEAAAPESTAQLRTVVLGSVVFFELVGPWMVRQTVVRAGEVKLAQLLPDSEATTTEAVQWVRGELERNLGLVRGNALAAHDGPTVRHAMRRKPDLVAEDVPFERVLKRLGEGRGELLPVVDREGRFRGLISYHEVKNTLYDPALRDLVIAGDLSTRVTDPLAADSSLAEALERMDQHGVNSWPVVEDGRLLGMVRRPDVYALFHGSLRGGGSGRGPSGA